MFRLFHLETQTQESVLFSPCLQGFEFKTEMTKEKAVEFFGTSRIDSNWTLVYGRNICLGRVLEYRRRTLVRDNHKEFDEITFIYPFRCVAFDLESTGIQHPIEITQFACSLFDAQASWRDDPECYERLVSPQNEDWIQFSEDARALSGWTSSSDAHREPFDRVWLDALVFLHDAFCIDTCEIDQLFASLTMDDNAEPEESSSYILLPPLLWFAHNAFEFDAPLLATTLQKCHIPWPEHWHLADFLITFRTFFFTNSKFQELFVTI